MTSVAEVLGIIEERGNQAYLGEAVSIAEHMLQTAHLARASGASASLIAAALLHDFGHLVHDEREDAAEHGIDTRHEDIAAAWLSRLFGPAVTEPIRLHVEAKRYLCATELGYLMVLSPASRLSLQLQGGPLPPNEVVAFASNPWAQDAVRIRRWDDSGKTAGLNVPPLDHYRELLERIAVHET
jgi:[1-hydroxy-2-(trimethylamino)ethyl]phosphonate dioxygenase